MCSHCSDPYQHFSLAYVTYEDDKVDPEENVNKYYYKVVIVDILLLVQNLLKII